MSARVHHSVFNIVPGPLSVMAAAYSRRMLCVVCSDERWCIYGGKRKLSVEASCWGVPALSTSLARVLFILVSTIPHPAHSTQHTQPLCVHVHTYLCTSELNNTSSTEGTAPRLLPQTVHVCSRQHLPEQPPIVGGHYIVPSPATSGLHPLASPPH